MKPVASISVIASLLADPKRSAMLWALIDGMARPSEELAKMTGLTPSSTCAHLGRLLAGGLLKIEARGRKRYFRLAAPEVGAAVEALASVPVQENFRQGVRVSREASGIPLAMRRARLCRDHLGGDLAADLYQRLLDAKWLEVSDRQLEVSQAGRDISAEQLAAGLAWHYVHYAQRDQAPAHFQRYQQLQAQARQQGAGLWQQARPQAPWDYRQQRR